MNPVVRSKRDGPCDAYCWGLNNFGQVGDNSQTDRLTPQPVSGGLTFQTP